MQPLGVVGSGATAVVERLAPRLDGRVATVEAQPVDEDRPEGVAASYRLGTSGWTAGGDSRSLSAFLDSLAPDYDYVLLSGFPEARVPTVALGGADAREVVHSAADADSLDLDAVCDLVAGLEPHVTLESLVDRIKESPRADRAGAIATFTGRVRAKDHDDDSPTLHLEFEKYDGVAEERMATICDELESRDGVQDVLMHHRTGLLEDGEDIVFVVVLAGHREEAFRTVEDGINRLKDEVPIFKKEATVDEEFWVHDRS